MMSYVFMLNYVSPLDKDVYTVACHLILDYFKDDIPIETMNYIKIHYLNPLQPELLGGGCSGSQGHSGSTNACERFGRDVKGIFSDMELTTEEMQNPINIMRAVAISLSTMSCPTDEASLERNKPQGGFACEPYYTIQNFDFLRKIAKKPKVKDAPFFPEFLYCIVTRENGDIIRQVK